MIHDIDQVQLKMVVKRTGSALFPVSDAAIQGKRDRNNKRCFEKLC